MENFINWLKEYWTYAIGLVAVCVVAFFVFRAAVRSYKRYYERYRKQEAEIKHLVELKEKYGVLTTEAIANADEEELLEGTALSYQLALQKSEDMSAEFSKLNNEKKYIYALDVLVQDKSVETFFKENGKELTEIIIPALELIELNRAATQAEKIRRMFDEKDETASINSSEIKECENYFSDNNIIAMIKHNAAKYIKENSEKFI